MFAFCGWHDVVPDVPGRTGAAVAHPGDNALKCLRSHVGVGADQRRLCWLQHCLWRSVRRRVHVVHQLHVPYALLRLRLGTHTSTAAAANSGDNFAQRHASLQANQSYVVTNDVVLRTAWPKAVRGLALFDRLRPDSAAMLAGDASHHDGGGLDSATLSSLFVELLGDEQRVDDRSLLPTVGLPEEFEEMVSSIRVTQETLPGWNTLYGTVRTHALARSQLCLTRVRAGEQLCRRAGQRRPAADERALVPRHVDAGAHFSRRAAPRGDAKRHRRAGAWPAHLDWRRARLLR